MISAAAVSRQPFSWMLLNYDELAGSVILKRLVSRVLVWALACPTVLIRLSYSCRPVPLVAATSYSKL